MAASQVATPLYRNGATAGLQLYTCVANTKNYLHKVRLVAAAAAATALVYDNTSAAGRLLATLGAIVNGYDETDYNGSLDFTIGLYIVVVGTGAQLLVTYE